MPSQARREKISLRAFLFRRGVPGIASPAYPCGQGGDQTAAHLFAECTDPKSRAMRATGFSTKGEVWEGLSDHRKAPGMARASIGSGRLLQFSVFIELRLQESTAAEEESAWVRRLLPGQERRRRPIRSAAHGTAYPDNILRIGRSLQGFLSGKHGFPCP